MGNNQEQSMALHLEFQEGQESRVGLGRGEAPVGKCDVTVSVQSPEEGATFLDS